MLINASYQSILPFYLFFSSEIVLGPNGNCSTLLLPPQQKPRRGLLFVVHGWSLRSLNRMSRINSTWVVNYESWIMSRELWVVNYELISRSIYPHASAYLIVERISRVPDAIDTSQRQVLRPSPGICGSIFFQNYCMSTVLYSTVRRKFPKCNLERSTTKALDNTVLLYS